MDITVEIDDDDVFEALNKRLRINPTNTEVHESYGVVGNVINIDGGDLSISNGTILNGDLTGDVSISNAGIDAQYINSDGENIDEECTGDVQANITISPVNGGYCITVNGNIQVSIT